MVENNYIMNKRISAFDNKLNTFDYDIYYHNRDNEYRADPFLGFRLKKLEKHINNKLILKTNSLGLRASELVNNDSFDTLFLGGSFIYGVNAPNDNSTIPNFFSTITKLSVINAGIPGHVLKQHFSLYFNYLMKLNINKIILVFGFNDLANCFNNKSYGELSIDNYQRVVDEINNYPIKQPLKILIRNLLNIKKFKIKNLERIRNKKVISLKNKEKIIETYCNEILNDILLFNNFCENNQIKLYNILQPNLLTSKKKFSEYEKIYLSKFENDKKEFILSFYKILCEKLKIVKNFKNFSSIYDSYERTVFTDEVHVGDFGNKIFSENLIDFINNK